MKKNTVKTFLEFKDLLLFFENTLPSVYKIFLEQNKDIIGWLESSFNIFDEKVCYNKLNETELKLTGSEIEQKVLSCLIKDKIQLFFCILKNNNDKCLNHEKIAKHEENVDLSSLMI